MLCCAVLCCTHGLLSSVCVWCRFVQGECGEDADETFVQQNAAIRAMATEFLKSFLSYVQGHQAMEVHT